ncbi:restriction endonuclease subunit S [Streptomyces sp. NPDC049687]|uniref:restriction endonuclease subunit S n=1 Tax=Streptomyces sp. NPDC049687 TaxID=3365596 RepID=UPI0037B6728D
MKDLSFLGPGGTGLRNLPAHWTTVPLWSMFERIKDTGHPEETMLSVFREYGVIPKDSRENLNQTAENRNIYQLVHPGWLVVNRMKAWQGSVGISDYRGIVSGHYICFAPRHNADSKYLNYLLRSETYRDVYRGLSRGVRPGQIEIDNDQLRKIPIALPPLSEQRAIVDFVDRETAEIDALIAAQERFIGLLDERRASTISTSIERYNESSVHLRYLATIQSGITLSGEGDPEDPEWPYLRVANVQMGFVDLDEIKTIRVSHTAAQKARLRVGDVLMTEGGDIDKLGRGAVWYGEIPNALHQNHIFAARTGPRLDPKFLMYYLDGPTARNYFRVTAKKTTNLASTNKWTTGSLPVGLPPLDEQHRIVAHLDAETAKIDTLLETTRRHIALAKERRSALITATVTGQIDTRKAV